MKKVTAKNLMIGDWVKYRGKYKQVEYLPKTPFHRILKIAPVIVDNECSD